MHTVTRCLAVFSFAWLSACGAKDDVIKPSSLPSIHASVKVENVWSTQTWLAGDSAGVRLVPAVTAQMVVAAGEDGRLGAYDRANGRARWSVDTGLALSAGPAVGYGQVFVGTHEGEVASYSAVDGRFLWKRDLGGEVLASPDVEGDAVLVKAADGHITLLDRVSGSVRWMYDAGIPPLTLRNASKPVLVSDAAIVGLPNGEFVALDRSSGQVLWERRIAEPTGKSELERLVDVAGDFLLSDTRLYAATFQGRVVAMDLRTGQFDWQQNFSTFQSLAASADTLYGVDADSRIVAWRNSDGIVLWRQEALLGRGLTGCAVVGNYLLAGDYDGYVHVIRRDTGEIVGRRRVGHVGIVATPVVDEDEVFVLGRGGRLADLKVK